MRYFQYNLSSLTNPNYGWITLDRNNIHKIANVDEFYKALGFTDAIKQTGILAEEFVWAEYRKDHSKKAEICFQIKIIEYLKLHSAAFSEKYAAECEEWTAICEERCLRKDSICANCTSMQAG